jgi:hypothetical protein
MPEDFVIACNTEPGLTLSYLLGVPLGDGIASQGEGHVAGYGKVYCHRVEEWPDGPEIIIADARGRQMLFGQTARTSKQARPAVSLAGACGSVLDDDLEIAVDIRERNPFTFADRQPTTRREPLNAGDYGLLVDGLLQARVERKSLADPVSSLTTSKLEFQLTELAVIFARRGRRRRGLLAGLRGRPRPAQRRVRRDCRVPDLQVLLRAPLWSSTCAAGAGTTPDPLRLILVDLLTVLSSSRLPTLFCGTAANAV